MRTTFIFESSPEIPSCHASSICELPNGDLLAAWYAGSRESAPDSFIMGARKPAGAVDWETPQVWVNVHQHAAGNPRVFFGPDGLVWLIAPINYGRWCNGGTRLYLKRSADFGRRWTDLEIFWDAPRILGKNKPIALKSGVWLAPVEHEGWGTVDFLRSSDEGSSWQLISVPDEGVYLDQPTVIQRADGSLLALMRSREGMVFQTESTDDGMSWSIAAPTLLKNSNVGIDMVRLNDGRLLLVYTPMALGKNGDLIKARIHGEVVFCRWAPELILAADPRERGRLIAQYRVENQSQTLREHEWGVRTPLSIAVSADEGKTWERTLDLETDPGEFSYPAVIQSTNGEIHITYTWQRTKIREKVLLPDEL
ncbi:MAG: exo-alpha-sialidase [Anaerolineaceae bacterium]|nr:exo-alpha-sialidase [Anaerolineaceae bacterium]